MLLQVEYNSVILPVKVVVLKSGIKLRKKMFFSIVFSGKIHLFRTNAKFEPITSPET